jgi:hypothetical protein
MATIRRLAPIVTRRVQASYKPRYVALISGPTRELVEPLEQAGWGGRLFLDHGSPFEAPPTESPMPAGRSLADHLLASFKAAAR